MMRPIVHSAIVIFVIAATGDAPVARAANPASQNSIVVNRGVVELETGLADDISVRLAEEVASIIDDGATRRVVPVVGKGPLQNLIDLKYLRGIDLAIVQSDALDYARVQQSPPGIESLTFVAKLCNEEFHLLARPDVKQVSDLAGQIVNIDVKGSGTALTAARLFDLLNIKAKLANDNRVVALEKLRKGEIAAIALVVAEPAPFFHDLKSDAGLHLLNIPLTQTVTAAYAPTRITSADYPNLVAADQPVDTIAVGNVLMAADLHMIAERYRNVSNFIDTFFTGYQSLLAPGYSPKWRDVNIAADVPGWTRNPAAAAWLRNNPQVAAVPEPEALQSLFARFIDERRQASGGAPMSAADKAALFQQFQAWQRGRAK